MDVTKFTASEKQNSSKIWDNKTCPEWNRCGYPAGKKAPSPSQLFKLWSIFTWDMLRRMWFTRAHQCRVVGFSAAVGAVELDKEMRINTLYEKLKWRRTIFGIFCCIWASKITSSCQYIPRPMASDPFIIFSFLHVFINILQMLQPLLEKHFARGNK